MMFRILGVIGIIVVAMTVQPVLAEARGDGSRDKGRYEAVAAAGNAIWVVDTQTGRVRRCVQDFAGQAPSCSAYSK